MSAEAEGYKRGRDYLSAHSLEDLKKTTFEQFSVYGRTIAKHDYQRQQTQSKFMLGWWHAGNQFITLFKLDDGDQHGAEQMTQQIDRQLTAVYTKLELLCEWRKDDEMLQHYLQHAYDLLGTVLLDLDLAVKHLKKPMEKP